MSNTHQSFRAKFRYAVSETKVLENPRFQTIASFWHSQSKNDTGLPTFDQFDILDLPGSVWSNLFLAKLFGQPRRFFYELVGGGIEEHNGFSAQKRFLTELPLKNKHAMALEFVHALHEKMPVYSEGPYIGAADYVRTVKRVICPFDMGNRMFAFLGIVEFENYSPEELQKVKLANKANVSLGSEAI